MTDCIFCKIIAREIPSARVYEDDTSYAFLDIKPINPGHTLLIPKEHHANLYDLPDALLSQLAPNIKKLSIVIKEATNADGINIGMNNGAAAGQIVGHAHIHIIPRFEGDALNHWPGTAYTEGEMEKMKERISKAFL